MVLSRHDKTVDRDIKPQYKPVTQEKKSAMTENIRYVEMFLLEKVPPQYDENFTHDRLLSLSQLRVLSHKALNKN